MENESKIVCRKCQGPHLTIKCGKETMKRVCLCYSKLLIITRSYFNEYFKLGQAIVLLSEIVANNGPDSLIGCKFELPFDHSSNLIPI